MGTRETGEELLEHRMSTVEMTDPIAVHPRCDMVLEGQFVIQLEEKTVSPRYDMEANEANGKEIENDAVRPKCDIDAEGMIDNMIEENAVRPKSDMDAEYKENGAPAAINILEINDEVSKEDVEIRRHIEERRNTSKVEKQRLKDLSKQIRKCIRDKQRTERQKKIQKILEDFKGIKNIPSIKSAKKKKSSQRKMKKAKVITSRKGIANVFGEFYSKLYEDDQNNETDTKSDTNESETNIEDQGTDAKETKEIPEITIEELQAVINRLKKRQCSRQQWNQSRRHQSMQRRNERNGETDLQ